MNPMPSAAPSPGTAPLLRRSMIAGAIYDFALGLSILGALELLALVLPIPFPAEPFYARTQGALLLGLGTFYAFAAHDLQRNLRNVAGAIVARTAGGLYISIYPLCDPSVSPFFLLFGGLDLLWAALHLYLLRRERVARFWPLLWRGEVVPPSP
ncbi:MAG: hypothetical protein IPN34_08775 [Planctomycetes bacterium]|nr:hypothetical protein [Planctomycetota bacterium]